MDKKTRTLDVDISCTAYYHSEIEVPEDMTLERAIEYAKEHLEEIPVTELEYIDDREDCLDDDSKNWEFEKKES